MQEVERCLYQLKRISMMIGRGMRAQLPHRVGRFSHEAQEFRHASRPQSRANLWWILIRTRIQQSVSVGFQAELEHLTKRNARKLHHRDPSRFASFVFRKGSPNHTARNNSEREILKVLVIFSMSISEGFSKRIGNPNLASS